MNGGRTRPAASVCGITSTTELTKYRSEATSTTKRRSSPEPGLTQPGASVSQSHRPASERGEPGRG